MEISHGQRAHQEREELRRQERANEPRMTLFADNAVIQAEAERVSVSCDRSLDEGDAIIRADFAAGIGSTGREYFVQVDPTEVGVLLALIEVAGDCGGDTDAAEVVDNFRSRIERVKAYREER